MSESSPRLKRCISVFAYVCGIFACENYGSVLGSIHSSPEPTLQLLTIYSDVQLQQTDEGHTEGGLTMIDMFEMVTQKEEDNSDE